MNSVGFPTESQTQRAENLFARLRELPESDQQAALGAEPDEVVRELVRETLAASPDPGALQPGFPIHEDLHVIRPLAGGGFGHTYEVEHTMGGKAYQEVLKLLRPDLLWSASPDRVQALQAQFMQEVRAMKELRHPHIVGILDAGEIELRKGLPRVPWFTMEHVEGIRLAEPRHDGTTFLAAPSLGNTQAKIRCVERLCDAVDHAHGHGHRHLDITPMNVLVKPDGMPMLIDFGLTERIRPDWNNPPWLRRGTLPFMAPEQLEPLEAGVGRHTDVHALGVLLFLLLTERLPHRLQQPDDHALRHAILHEDRIPLGELWKDSDPDLREILRKAMDRDPKARYQTAQELGSALQAWLTQSPTFASLSQAARPYLLRLEAASRKLPLRGLDPKANDPTRENLLGLDQVYISLDTSERRRRKAGTPKGRPDKVIPASRETDGGEEKVPALDAVRENRVVVLLGDPGSGKTTFLNHLAWCLTHDHDQANPSLSTRLPGWTQTEARILPVLFVLRQFVKWVREKHSKPDGTLPCGSARFFWCFFREEALSDEPSATSALQQAADQGWVIFFLDGIDEVPDPALRIFVRDCAMDLAILYPKARIVATCRTIPYQEKSWQLPGVPTFTLEPFDNPKIKLFVQAWFEAHRDPGGMPADQAHSKRDKLVGAILDPHRPELRRLAGNPMLLTVMALLQTDQRELPEHRAELYAAVIELLLRRWEETRSDDGILTKGITELLREKGADRKDLDRVLARLAWQAQIDCVGKARDSLADIPRHKLLDALETLCRRPHGPDLVWAAQLMETIHQRSGLLVNVEEKLFRFPHRSFQEYLAAAFLIDGDKLGPETGEPATGLEREVRDYPDGIACLLDASAYWREVIRWTAGVAVHVKDRPRDGMSILEELCPIDVLSRNHPWERVWIAGEALHEIRIEKVMDRERGRTVAERIRGLLVQLVERSDQPLQTLNRHLAGIALANIGDPRRGVAPPWPPTPDQPFFDWVGPIGPDPRFHMGGDPHAFQSTPEPVSWPIHSPFLLAKYPVTNAQYDLFESSDYFRDHGMEKRDKSDPRFNVANHPVVNVSWHDAMHFCAWLNAQLEAGVLSPETLGVAADALSSAGGRVALPSEAQWELAARGPSGRWLPWTDDQHPPNDTDLMHRCNWSKSGIQCTSAVGLFPSGAAPWGALDMIGNVWEWTRSEWQEEPKSTENHDEVHPHSDKPRVLRGGSWGSNGRGFLRCAARIDHLPAVRSLNFGFRVVWVGASASGR